MNGYIPLSWLDLALASVFVLLNASVSLALSLRLERQLLIASLRMVVQLLLIGLVLRAVFAAASPWLTLAVAVAMAGFASREIWARQEKRLRGGWGYGLGAATMAVAGTLVTVFALGLTRRRIIGTCRASPRRHPQYASTAQLGD